MPIILYKNCQIEEDLYSDIYRRIKDGKYDSFILIVPTRRKVRELQRELLSFAEKYSSPALNLFTLATFAAKLGEIFLPPMIQLNETTQAIVFEQAIKNCKKELKYFFSSTRQTQIPFGTFKKIISVINKLKETGVYLSGLYAELQSAADFEKQKLLDIILIYEEYEKLLGKRFIDSAGMYKRLNELVFDNSIAEKFFNSFVNLERLYISGFDEFKNPEITLIENISKLNLKGKSFGTVISFDYHFNNDELFGHLKDNYEKFIKMGFNLYEKGGNQDDDFKNYIIKNLFKKKDVVVKSSFKKKVTLISSETRQEEIETVAKIIKYIMHKNPQKDLSKICVCMIQPQLYTKLFYEVFSRYGIPANITDRFSLDQSPVVVSVISLLNVVRKNLMRRDLIISLSSPYFTFTSNGSKIDTTNLINISAGLKILYDEKLWKEKIEKRMKQIEIELQEVDDEITHHNYQRELFHLHKAKDDIDAFLQIIRKLKIDLTPEDFRLTLLQILDELQVEKNILSYKYDNLELLEKDTRAYQKFIDVLDELTKMIIFEYGSERTFNIGFYIDKLKAAISQTRYNIRQKYGYGVYVTSLEETRGLDFETMFIIGLVDGEFPQQYFPEIFFSRERQKLKEKYHLSEQRYLFYQCLTNFSDYLYLSYPRREDEVELVKSPFIDAVVEIIELENYEDNLKANLNEYEFCEEELLSKIGHNIGIDANITQLDKFDVRVKENINFMTNIINIEKQRYSVETKFEYNGYISEKLSEEASTKLSSQKNKIYSITQLEKYAKCPFSYFLSNLLKVEPTKELEEGITPLEKGSILHEILYEFYSERVKNNLPLLSECNNEQYNQALERIIKIAQDKLEMIETADVLAFLDKELIIGTENRKGLLEVFIEHERERNISIKPRYFEVAFGGNIGGQKRKDQEISTDRPLELDEYRIRGRVDRVDLGDDYFSIIDYKTGKSQYKLTDIEKGLVLQLPVYLFAIEKILLEKYNKHYKPTAAIYFNMSDAVKEQILVANKDYMEKAFPKVRESASLLRDESELRNIISTAVKYIKTYIGDISSGKFPLANDENRKVVCQYCNYDKVCRKQLILEI